MKNKEELLKLAANFAELSANFSAMAESIRNLTEKLDGAVEEVKNEPKEETTKETEPAPKPEKKYTLEDVRQVLSEKSGAGFTSEVRALLIKHGGAKLSAIPEGEYAALMEEALKLVKEEQKTE